MWVYPKRDKPKIGHDRKVGLSVSVNLLKMVNELNQNFNRVRIRVSSQLTEMVALPIVLDSGVSSGGSGAGRGGHP
jgi:hypothetical protein